MLCTYCRKKLFYFMETPCCQDGYNQSDRTGSQKKGSSRGIAVHCAFGEIVAGERIRGPDLVDPAKTGGLDTYSKKISPNPCY